MGERTKGSNVPFKLQSLSRTTTNENSVDNVDLHQPAITSLQISPPKIDRETVTRMPNDNTQDKPVDSTDITTVSGNEFKMAKLFRNQSNSNSKKKRPNLSLKTRLNTNNNQEKSQVSLNLPPTTSSNGFFIHSPLTPVSRISNKIRRPRKNSNRSGSSFKTRTRSISRSRSGSVFMANKEAKISNAVPRSAKVLSFIAADDMDEFESIERDFRTAVDNKGLTWLPQIETENNDNVRSDIYEDNTFQQSDYIMQEDGELQENLKNIFDDYNEINNMSKRNIPESITIQESSLPKKIINNGSTLEGSLFSPKSDSKKETEDILEDETIKFTTDSLVELLPDFDKPFKGIKKPIKLYGKSLNIFSPTNPTRMKLANIHQNRVTKRIYAILLLLFTFLLAYRTYHPLNYDFLYRFSHWTDYLIFIIYIVFTVNDITKILAFGFWDDSEMFAAHGKEYISILERCNIVQLYELLVKKYGRKSIDLLLPFKIKTSKERKKRQEIIRNHYSNVSNPSININDFDTPRAFARTSWNRIDFVSTVCFWIGLFMSIKNVDNKKGVRIFKPLALLRILRLLNTDTGISSILRTLKYGIPQLVNVGSMLVYFWIFFAILGVQLFQGSFRRQCVWINPDDPTETYQYDMQFCGGYLDPVSKKPLPYVYSDGASGLHSKGFLCPVNSKCISNSNPYNGRISFDNIINSMELIFVVMSANTFTDLMYYTMDSDEMVAAVFFIVCIFVLTIWMMNLLIAVLVSSYDLAYEKHRKKKIEKHNLDNWPLGLIRGYWQYFKVKASSTPLPNWSVKFLYWYNQFEWIFVLLIFTDLVARACINGKSDDAYLMKAKRIDWGVSIALLLESILRIILYSPNMWKFIVKLNYVYDLIIAIVTTIISRMAVTGHIGYVYYWLSIFQITRFYRVITTITFVKKLWKVVLKNGLMIWNLSSFYFLFVFLVAIIMSVYFEGVVPISQMDNDAFAMYSLPNSFLSLFIIGSTENWTNILYVVQQYSPNISSAFFSTVFLITWFILSNSVVLNIFIALISESLETDESQKRLLQIKHYLQKIYPQKIQEYTHASLIQRIRKKFFDKNNVSDSKDFKQFLMRGTAIMNIAHNIDELVEEMKQKQKQDHDPIQQNGFIKYLRSKINLKVYRNIWNIFSKNPFYKKSEVIFTETVDDDERSYILQLNEYEDEKLVYLKRHPTFNYSYFLFSPNHNFRKLCQRLVPPSVGKRTDGIKFYDDETDLYTQKKFFHRVERDLFVGLYAILTVLLVVISCLFTPLYRKIHNVSVIGWPLYIDCAFVSMFSIEFIVKTVADGFIYSPNAYLRNPWNAIDFVVLLYMWMYIITFLRNDGSVSRAFRGLSALRALRCLTISNTARQTFNMVIFQGVKKLFQAALVSISLLFPFTIWGIGLFRNRLGTCNDGSVGLSNCYNEYTNTVFQWDIIMPRVYSQPYLYLNSFASSFRSLYEIISLEGWVDLLTNLMNSTGVGTIAKPWSNPASAIFLVLFNFLSMVFILNLFVSFIIKNYAENTGTAYYTSKEKAWLESKKMLSQAKPKAKPNMFEMSNIRRTVYSIAVEKKNFYYAIFLQVVLYMHVIMLLCLSYEKNNSVTKFSQIYFMFSTTVFLIQECLHIYGEGLLLYTRETWNCVRFCIVYVAFLLSAIGFNVSFINIAFHNVKNIFQLMIFLFIIPQSDTLSELLETAAASLPSILSLTYTWGILFLVYAMALNQIFGLTRLGPNTTDNINVRTITKALILLFRCSFGEGWNYIMDDFTVNMPYCYQDPITKTSDCGSVQYAYILLMTWNILSMYIFLNMFISLVVGNFSYVYRKGSSNSPVDRTEINKYIDAWCKLDADGAGELEFSQLPKLMHSFDGSLSFKLWEGPLTVKNLVNNYIKVNPNDPYDVKVDLDGLNKELDTINKAKMIYKRLQYRRFIQEMNYTHGYEGIIKFNSLLETVPLYTVYDPRECLGIDLYVKYLYVLNKVDKYLANEKNVDVLNMIVVKWKYLLRKRNKKYMNKTEIEKDTNDPKLVISDPFNDPIYDINPEHLFLTTPKMDFGINKFRWSPKVRDCNQSSNNSNVSSRFDWTTTLNDDNIK